MRSILTILICICSFILYSQGISLGVKGGPSFFKARMDVRDGLNHDLSIHETKIGLGYNAGFLITSNSESVIGYDIEFGAVSKAFNQKGAVSGTNILYLELPIHLKARIVPKLEILIGPELSYKLSSYLFTEFQFGLSGGVNYRLSDSIGLRGRYSHNLSLATEYNITDINGNLIGDVKAYHTGVSLSAVYYIN